MADDIVYDRPVKAALWVHLENGEKWAAGPEDLRRFRLEQYGDAYHLGSLP